ncbi:HAD-IC family P-type ATPase [Actinomarinicola tropica]|uniref:HAD-IC family P-type ATPase n=1 Tax=Actinomarinicola tropica TaxID=2789776 RepID=A0A5Q2RDA5_9ACTN|nr:HAD-IC family P-type ATPase [Actinomarinicola tropica]QGG93643.1 HAD-IC family P-type ATPase [Actinomarinicola tropica]
MAPHAPPLHGLTADEVEERTRDGRINLVPDTPTRTVGQIVRANVLTPVNGIISVMFVLIMIAAPGPDALFAGVVISNSVIGIVQELRAKRELDRLAVLNAPRARVVRDGHVAEIGISGVVADEVLELQPGDQIVVDGEVLVSHGLEANESLLTGESDPVLKEKGDQVMSGSFVAAGSGYYRATRIGAESYAAALAEEARRFQLAHSELRRGINLILRWLVVIIPPVSVLLLASLLSAEDEWREALRGTVAAAVAMVPDGLVLLTSIAFIVGILGLARRKALAKELASVELLARVDTLCLDKTGTITTGEIAYTDVVLLADDLTGVDEVHAALGALVAADPNPNATLAAIGEVLAAPHDWSPRTVIPFSSARKWSAADFDGRGCWVLGAPEVVLEGAAADAGDQVERCRDEVARHADAGRRIVLLARADLALDQSHRDGALPHGVAPVALVLLEDQVRPDAEEILRYFSDQGITLKVISGDHPATVAAVAGRAGIDALGPPMDARDLPDDEEELATVLDGTTVFGRVTPHQKRAMVGALQRHGHVVAMTGDGVNDVLALKDADMGIAMGAGSASARAVAQLVLLDNAFATLPTVLAEGRRVINNIERVANVFVAKAAYAVLLAALTGLFSVPFPFLPRHLTIVGTFSIGIPGFFLALEPNVRRAVPGFVGRVVRFAIPSGVVAGLASWVAYSEVRDRTGVELDEARTLAVCVLLALGLYILGLLCRPLNTYRIVLLAAMVGGYLVALTWGPVQEFFALTLPDTEHWTLGAVCALVGMAVLEVGPRLLPGWDLPPRTERVDGHRPVSGTRLPD